MEIPARVSVFNPILEIKGKAATLVAVSDDGFFEVTMEVRDKIHTILLPIAQTVIIYNEPVPQITADFEVER